MGVDIVGKRENFLVIGIIVLDGNLYLDILPGTAEVNRFCVQRRLGSIEIFDKGNDTALIMEDVALVSAFINNLNFDSGIEESHFPNTLREGFERKLRCFKNFRIRPEEDPRPAAFGVAILN